MKKLLLIVDPQYDFITGSLPVGGAADAMTALAGYIRHNDGDYTVKLVTTDWHPYHHCSFVEQGGPWPRHCVQDSQGAAIWQPLLEALNETSGDTFVLRKGTQQNREEYSIFKNRVSAMQIAKTLKAYDIDQIDICGLAGDICVLNTLKDGEAKYGRSCFHVLTDFAPSLDGGKALAEHLAALK